MKIKLTPKCDDALIVAHRLLDREYSKRHYSGCEPGELALELCPHLLSELSRGVHSIVVTGTNGKTMTARFICSILSEAGIDFFSNRDGANMSGRIATLFIENFNPEIGLMKNRAVLECDEAYLRYVIPEIQPDILVVTNIYPDQKERLESQEYVAELILSAMKNTKPAICIMEADCHCKDTLQSLPDWKYIEYSAMNGKIQTSSFIYRPKMKTPGSYNILNAAAAVNCAEVLDIPSDVILKGIENTNPAYGRMETFIYENHLVLLTMVKNPAGFQVVSDYLRTERIKKFPCSPLEDTWIIVMNRYTGEDIRWMAEIRYATVTKYFKNTLIAGDCAGIVKLHTDREMVDKKVISMREIPKVIQKANGSVVITADYDSMMDIRKTFVEKGVIHPYWED